MINPKPGNQPDQDDMSVAFEEEGDASPITPQPNLEEEDEAARLGDFA